MARKKRSEEETEQDDRFEQDGEEPVRYTSRRGRAKKRCFCEGSEHDHGCPNGM